MWRRRRGYRRGGNRSGLIVAFGIGLCAALAFSPRLTLFFAALILIYVGITGCR